MYIVKKNIYTIVDPQTIKNRILTDIQFLLVQLSITINVKRIFEQQYNQRYSPV